MITKFPMISDLFKELDEISSKEVHIFLIGGGALMKHNLKPYTKDIDIVLTLWVNSKSCPAYL